MAFAMRAAGSLLAVASLAVAAPGSLPQSIATSTVTVDIAIVGAGASGAYAAIRLKEDFNKSIAIIDKASDLVRRRLPLAPILPQRGS